jgi:hypothetical protein
MGGMPGPGSSMPVGGGAPSGGMAQSAGPQGVSAASAMSQVAPAPAKAGPSLPFGNLGAPQPAAPAQPAPQPQAASPTTANILNIVASAVGAVVKSGVLDDVLGKKKK